MSWLKAECAALDEDEQAQGDQHERVQDVAPAADHPRHGRAGSEEPPGSAPGADQEDHDVCSDPRGPLLAKTGRYTPMLSLPFAKVTAATCRI